MNKSDLQNLTEAYETTRKYFTFPSFFHAVLELKHLMEKYERGALSESFIGEIQRVFSKACGVEFAKDITAVFEKHLNK